MAEPNPLADRWRGALLGTAIGFAEAARGVPYEEVAASLFGGTGSFGNGAAMRAAPAAVVGSGDLGEVAAIARAQAAVTHAHRLGRDGAALLAMAVAAAATTEAPVDGLADVGGELETEQMRTGLEAALELAEAEPIAIAGRVGHGIAAVEAVPAAIAAFLGAPDQPRSLFVRAVAIGGDTDTIAAMAGAILGAHVGADALPGSLLQRLEGRTELSRLADELSAIGTHW